DHAGSAVREVARCRLQDEIRQFARAVAEAFHGYPELIKYRHVEVREGRLLAILNMLSTFQPSSTATRKKDRHISDRMLAAIAHPGTVNDHHMIQQGAIPVGRHSQSLEEIGEQCHVMDVDFPQLLQLVRGVLVVRDRVVRIRNAELRIRAAAQLPAYHERYYAREVGLIGQYLQVEHQLRMVFELRRDTGWLPNRRELEVALLFGLLDTTLDVTNSFEIFIELAAVPGSKFSLSSCNLFPYRIENAALAANAGSPHSRIRGPRVAKEPLEDDARIGLRRQRRRRAAPRDRICIGTAITQVAVSNRLRRFQAELQRGELRLLAKLSRSELVHRNACLDFGTGRILRRDVC